MNRDYTGSWFLRKKNLNVHNTYCNCKRADCKSRSQYFSSYYIFKDWNQFESIMNSLVIVSTKSKEELPS